jgi:hypothetical protein
VQQWPHIFIADFDGSFFDLQDEDDEYQDNPVNYQHKPFPEEEQIEADIPKVDGRYPPVRPPSFFLSIHSLTLNRKYTATSSPSYSEKEMSPAHATPR